MDVYSAPLISINSSSYTDPFYMTILDKTASSRLLCIAHDQAMAGSRKARGEKSRERRCSRDPARPYHL